MIKNMKKLLLLLIISFLFSFSSVSAMTISSTPAPRQPASNECAIRTIGFFGGTSAIDWGTEYELISYVSKDSNGNATFGYYDNDGYGNTPIRTFLYVGGNEDYKLVSGSWVQQANNYIIAISYPSVTSVWVKDLYSNFLTVASNSFSSTCDLVGGETESMIGNTGTFASAMDYQITTGTKYVLANSQIIDPITGDVSQDLTNYPYSIVFTTVSPDSYASQGILTVYLNKTTDCYISTTGNDTDLVCGVHKFSYGIDSLSLVDVTSRTYRIDSTGVPCLNIRANNFVLTRSDGTSACVKSTSVYDDLIPTDPFTAVDYSGEDWGVLEPIKGAVETGINLVGSFFNLFINTIKTILQVVLGEPSQIINSMITIFNIIDDRLHVRAIYNYPVTWLTSFQSGLSGQGNFMETVNITGFKVGGHTFGSMKFLDFDVFNDAYATSPLKTVVVVSILMVLTLLAVRLFGWWV